MSLIERFRAERGGRSERVGLSMEAAFKYNGNSHTVGGLNTTMASQNAIWPSGGFESLVRRVHQQTGVVSAAVLARQLVMSQVWLEWFDPRTDQAVESEPGIEMLNDQRTRARRWMLAEHDVSYAGTFYLLRTPSGKLHRLRPDWVGLMVQAPEPPHPISGERGGMMELSWHPEAEIVGFAYHPGGRDSGVAAHLYTTSEMAAWSPEPSGLHLGVGQSWVTSVLAEVVADGQATDHIIRYFEHAATANMVVKTPPQVTTPQQFGAWVDKFEESAAGAENAWSNIYVAHGTDVEVVGAQLGQLAMKDLQGGFETRISARSRVPPTILGIREGLDGSALSQGNYGAARRAWADGWFEPSTESLMGALRWILDPRPRHRLRLDRPRILFLQEDRADEADIVLKYATAAKLLIDSGWKPETVGRVIHSHNMAELADPAGHTGATSVQTKGTAG